LRIFHCRARIGALAIGMIVSGCSTGGAGAGPPNVDCPIDGGPRSLPSEVLDLTNFKLTLPVDKPGKDALEIFQPELSTLSDQYFHVTCARDGVSFIAPSGGAKTKWTHFARSELREMTDGGGTPAGWSPNRGTHTMWLTEAVFHLPTKRPEVVTMQIHNATDDIIMIYLKRNLLYVQHNGTSLGVLDGNYVLGTKFNAKIVASNGIVQVYYNGELKSVSSHTAEGCFFKAGSYPHSNPTFGEAPDAYSEVVVYDVKIQHE
jgi:poly(beta-D-mannuronate) lyase